jgi:hypothetical protein
LIEISIEGVARKKRAVGSDSGDRGAASLLALISAISPVFGYKMVYIFKMYISLWKFS